MASKTVTLDNKFFAFWGMVLAAAAILLGGILGQLNMGLVAKIFNAIGQALILLAIAFPAWNHIGYKNVAWKIIYFVALIAYVVGVVLAAF